MKNSDQIANHYLYYIYFQLIPVLVVICWYKYVSIINAFLILIVFLVTANWIVNWIHAIEDNEYDTTTRS